MKKLFLIISLSMICMLSNAQIIEKSYSFETPTFSQIRGHEQLQFDGCMQSALIGQPSLPWQSVSLMLPEGQEAESIEVILSDFVELAGEHQLFPYQPSRTTGDNTPKALVKDESVYASRNIYPAENHGIVTTQYRNGFGFAFSSFTPVQYIPGTGKVMYAKKALVRVKLTASKADHHAMLWATPEIKSSVSRMAQNPEMIESYQTRGREVTAYDVLIITGAEFVDGYSEYCDYYNSIGLRNRIVTVADICNTVSGADNQTKIRNYIIQEYQNNGIMMVVLGGDVDIVPFRGLYCYVTSGGGNQEDYGIPADLYYSGLDGTWNDNGDNKWGEPGEDDLLPEIGISRMSFKNANELQNMIHKSLSYQQSPVLGEFRNIVLAGEHLYDSPNSNGSDFLELLIGTHDDNGYTTTGYPEDYNFTRLYEEEGNWSGDLLKNAINQGVGYVHHDGHANTTYVAGWYNITSSDFSGANGVTHNYVIFHTQGCDAGAFDQNSILEKMVTIQNFAPAVIGNSRYGWFNEGQTEGPGAHLEREMTDAQYNDRIGLLGCALSEGKCATAPWVTAPGQWEEGALRWNFYDLHVLGDGALSVWIDEPYTATVQCQTEIVVGTQSIEVNVSDPAGNALKNFRCLVYMNDEVIAMGTTDENGVAEVTFEGGLQQVGEMKMKVTGVNSFPQEIEMTGLPSNTPYIIYDSYVLSNGASQIDFGGNYAFDMVMKNVGSVNASNVTATMSCNSEYITITQPNATLGNVNGNQSVNLDNVFAFSVSNNVPNNTPVRFTITCTDGTDTWESHFTTKIYAPEFALVSTQLTGTSGNYVNPGDHGTIHFVFKNKGNAVSPSVTIDVYNSHPVIIANTSHWTVNNVNPNQEFSVDFEFDLSNEALAGVVYELPYAVQHGSYNLQGTYNLAIGKTMEGFESGDFTAYNWQQGSVVSAWQVVTENPYEGQYCAKSASIGDGETSTLTITMDFAQESEVSFYYKVSSESGYDKLSFSVDNSEKGNWSGEVNWTKAAYTISAGTHVLKWAYNKDFYMSSGSDCAWIDNIEFPATQVISDVEDDKTVGVALYPNPNHGTFTISLPEEPCEIVVLNAMGQLMHRQENAQGMTTLNLQELNNGMYFLQVKSGNSTKMVKFVKE